MSRARSSFIIGLIFLGFVACKKGQPELENLRSLAGFSLDQNAVSVASKLNPHFQISGRCSSEFSAIQISLDGGETWLAASALASSVNIQCAEGGTFSLAFNNNFSSQIASGSAASQGLWKFRASSELGFSDAQDLSLTTNQTGQLILVGSHSTTSGSYKLNGRVGNNLKASIASGYSLKGQVKVR